VGLAPNGGRSGIGQVARLIRKHIDRLTVMEDLQGPCPQRWRSGNGTVLGRAGGSRSHAAAPRRVQRGAKAPNPNRGRWAVPRSAGRTGNYRSKSGVMGLLRRMVRWHHVLIAGQDMGSHAAFVRMGASQMAVRYTAPI
jgi:hypothetical protein